MPTSAPCEGERRCNENPGLRGAGSVTLLTHGLVRREETEAGGWGSSGCPPPTCEALLGFLGGTPVTCDQRAGFICGVMYKSKKWENPRRLSLWESKVHVPIVQSNKEGAGTVPGKPWRGADAGPVCPSVQTQRDAPIPGRARPQPSCSPSPQTGSPWKTPMPPRPTPSRAQATGASSSFPSRRRLDAGHQTRHYLSRPVSPTGGQAC